MTIYSMAITLLLVMDPFGNIPTFLALLKDYTARRRRTIILREMAIALLVLILFLFFGKYILAGMNISEPALAIAGGVILFFIAIRMIFPRTEIPTESPKEEPMIVPLAVPLVAGPSSMATVILFSTSNPGKLGVLLAALLISWAISLVVLQFSDLLHRAIGRRGLNALARLMGMILTTMAVQMLLDGISKFVHQM
ncbi:MAG TPA: MarC family protein [Spirochaetia bacterium]|nr:MarC family protein [Spirochaetia bacterium]